jgi:hypothetical protein
MAQVLMEYPHLLKRLPSPWRGLRDFRSLKGFCSVFPSKPFGDTTLSEAMRGNDMGSVPTVRANLISAIFKYNDN